ASVAGVAARPAARLARHGIGSGSGGQPRPRQQCAHGSTGARMGPGGGGWPVPVRTGCLAG
ncbi:hypothetical protein ABTF68_22590, partial [Acinetobacter baumannii]